MSRYERTGQRDLTFSAWHRTLPHHCTAIDLDFLEYCQRCRAPLALIEIATGHHHRRKPTTVLRRLAQEAGVRAYLILYDVAETESGMENLRVARVEPDPCEPVSVTVEQVAGLVCRLHDEHICAQEVAA